MTDITLQLKAIPSVNDTIKPVGTICGVYDTAAMLASGVYVEDEGDIQLVEPIATVTGLGFVHITGIPFSSVSAAKDFMLAKREGTHAGEDIAGPAVLFFVASLSAQGLLDLAGLKRQVTLEYSNQVRTLIRKTKFTNGTIQMNGPYAENDYT